MTKQSSDQGAIGMFLEKNDSSPEELLRGQNELVERLRKAVPEDLVAWSKEACTVLDDIVTIGDASRSYTSSDLVVYGLSDKKDPKEAAEKLRMLQSAWKGLVKVKVVLWADDEEVVALFTAL